MFTSCLHPAEIITKTIFSLGDNPIMAIAVCYSGLKAMVTRFELMDHFVSVSADGSCKKQSALKDMCRLQSPISMAEEVG